MQLVSSKPQPVLDVPDQASAWIAKLSSDCVNEQDLEGFALWLARSHENKIAFDDVMELWEDLGCVKHMPFDIPKSVPKLDTVANNIDKTSAKTGQWKIPFAIAASLFLTFYAAVLWPVDEKTTHYSTAVGEQQLIALKDGSTITMNTNTRLEVQFSDSRRDITLHSGEAYFDVAKDADRPFVVQSCASKTRAIGTEFNVQCQSDSGNVIVTEGLVQVSSDNHPQADIVIVEPGQSVDISASAAVTNLKLLDTKNRLSWRKGQLVFEDTPLTEVLKQANRYSETPIYLGSPRLAELRVSGRFDSTDTQTLLSALKVSLLLDSSIQDDNSIILDKVIH